MAAKRVKIDYDEEVKSRPNTMAEDRISLLPDRLIYHIFSFLPTIYIVQMSVISQRWRYIWLSTPFIYFDFHTSSDRVRKRVMFLNFLTNSLRCRKQYMRVPKTSITSFKCEMSSSFPSGATRRIDDWLSFVVRMKVKELHLYGGGYCLPQFVLSASSLTVLKLRNMKLETPSPSHFPSLKVLSLSDVEVYSQSLQNLVSGCPIIEDLHLEKYNFGAPISFEGFFLGSYTFRGLDLAVSGTLKNISFSRVEITDQWLDRLISRLPLLERLTFWRCRWKSISIRTHSLKYLFCDVFNMREADLRTPNLVFLHLTCFAESNISVEAFQQLETNLYVRDSSMNKTSYYDLVRLLSNLKCLKKMTLTTECESALIIQKGVRNMSLPPLPNLKHLTLKIHGRLTRNLKLEESLLWCAPSVEAIEIYAS
ncbi:hypothetical protein FNV43_RR00168 [Rhamnella rubrinervis]|uniref:F-box domain-containing protein n=1 Tax=Rhamnella rubrinervis TaxID=2594499 RepID=A0A8K0HMD8_9ROSA|nr:hypothetical protein FNV43_RR00168 [Rhamnella rubrinervis]